MNKSCSLVLLYMLIVSFGFSQTTTAYKDLEIKKFYNVGISYTSVNGKTVYKANGKVVSKATYDKYNVSWENMQNCCPCILQFYNSKNELIQEAVQCQDCAVGYGKTFYRNGKIKVYSNYKENPTGDWTELWDREYCSIPHGEWTYYSEKGDTLYREFWDNGKFIQQVPEQTQPEIWDIKVTLDDHELKSADSIEIKDIPRLTFTPQYKNSATQKNDLMVEISAGIVGFNPIKKEIPIDGFNQFDLEEMLDEMGVPKGITTCFTFTTKNNGTHVDRFWLMVSYN